MSSPYPMDQAPDNKKAKSRLVVNFGADELKFVPADDFC